MQLPAWTSLRSPSPLWFRICLALVATLILVAFAATHVGLKERKQDLESRLKKQSWHTLQVLSAGALEPIISEDSAHLDTLVAESTRLDEDIHFMTIFNESGMELHSWTRPDVPAKSDNYTYTINVDFEGEKFGSIVASWDPSRHLQEISVDLARERNRLILALLTLTSLSLLLLHSMVVWPLNKMRNRLESLSFDGTSEPLRINSSMELSMLAKAINKLDKSMAESGKLSKELEFQAKHDLLTGLINRYAFEQELTEHLEKRKPGQIESTILYIDLDQFKLVNDTCGHAAGDELLVQLSSILEQEIREDDLFARLGGDEFALLLVDTPIKQGVEIAEKIRNAAQAFRFSWEGRSFAVETSIGAVPVNRHGDNFERLISAADEACYSAKNEGRNRVRCYLEEDEELRQRRDQGGWIPRIIKALENSRIVLYGQPIEPTDYRQNQGGYIEILARMLDENNELIQPGAFLPAAERYGLMPQIDKYVINNGKAWLEEQLAKGATPPICAINLSGHSLCDPDFRKFVVDMLQNNLHICQYLSFEITETAAVANLTAATNFMVEVSHYGCKFALDDFGSGMSSFTYLKNLPVDYVKIDGAFVQNILSDPTSLAMVNAISDIVSVMQIRSVAEYVENQEIREKLLEIGIDYVQGFGVAIPAPLSCYEMQNVATG